MQPRRPWVSALFALTCLALTQLPAPWQTALEYDRAAILGGQLWRLWSAHLVHFSMRHAALDGAAFFLLGSVLEPMLGHVRLLRVLALAAPAVTLSLLCLTPLLACYRGASALAMAVAVGAAAVLWRRGPWQRAAIASMALLVLAKAVIDGSGLLGIPLSSLPQNVAIVWQAHLAGALCGWLLRPRSTPVTTNAHVPVQRESAIGHAILSTTPHAASAHGTGQSEDA